jgi:hypothetical protein
MNRVRPKAGAGGAPLLLVRPLVRPARRARAEVTGGPAATPARSQR